MSNKRYIQTLEDLDKCFIDGKKVTDYLIDDSTEIDQLQNIELFKNISNNDKVVIYDLGRYYIDPMFKPIYVNAVDVSRAYGCILFKVDYSELSEIAAIEADDYIRAYVYGLKEFKLEHVFLALLHIIKGTVYISKNDLHVHVKGEIPTQEEWIAAVEEYKQNYRGA